MIMLHGWSKDRYPQVLSAMLCEAGLPPTSGVFVYSGFLPDEAISPEQSAAIASYFAPMTLEDCRFAKKAEIAAARWEAETAGIDVNGFTVRTDRESQALITGAALKAMQDSTYSCRWKGVGGFIELTAPQILAIADAVRSHVQSCFDREAELCGLIDKAKSPEKLDKIVF
jgi:hypothetical protein